MMKFKLQFNDLAPARNSSARAGLLLAIVPGLLLILYSTLSGVEGPNPFIVMLILVVGAPTVVGGLLVYLIADKSLQRKALLAVAIISFQVLILPIIWRINVLKSELFVFSNKEELELIANNIIDEKWSLEQARQHEALSRLHVNLDRYSGEDQTVFFVTGGMIDNCQGIAYSRTGTRATDNNCGRIISWNQLCSGNWYRWSTT